MRSIASFSLVALSLALAAPLATAADAMQADKPAMAASMPQDCHKMMEMHGQAASGNAGGMGMMNKDMKCGGAAAPARSASAAKASAKAKANAKAKAAKAEPEHDHTTHTTK